MPSIPSHIHQQIADLLRPYAGDPNAAAELQQMLSDELGWAAPDTNAEFARIYAESKLRNITEYMSGFLYSSRIAINGVVGFSQVILEGIDGPLDDELQQDIESIHEFGKYSTTLLFDLSDLVRLQWDASQIHPRETDISALLGIFPTTHIKIKLQKLSDTNALCDDRFTSQLLFNMINLVAIFTQERIVQITIDDLPNSPSPMLAIDITGNTTITFPKHIDDVLGDALHLSSGDTLYDSSIGTDIWIARQIAITHGGDLTVKHSDESLTLRITLPTAPPTD